MRIAFLLSHVSGLGGGKKLIGKFAYYLTLEGHDVEFFTQKYGKIFYKEFNKVKLNILKPSHKFFLPFIFLFKKFRGFDIIIFSDFPTAFSAIRNKNVIYLCCSPNRAFYDLKDYYFRTLNFRQKIILFFKNLFFKRLEFIAAQKSILILSISKNVQKRVEKYYKRKDSKIAYPAIDYGDYKEGEYGNYVFCPSRFVKVKRIDVAIKSMGFVKNKKIKLYVAGGGPEEEKIKKLAKKYPNVKLFGEVSDKKILELYSNCLSAISVPLQEDFGLVPIEAGASAKPTIASNEGGFKETIVNNKSGFLLRKVTPKEIAKKIDFLAANRQIAKKMGREARKIARKFDWRVVFPKWEKLILECLDGNKHPAS